MMLSWRRLLLCALLLAIPLQGMAAATMALCGPAHHAQSQPQVHVHHADPQDHPSAHEAADKPAHESAHEAAHKPAHKPAHKCSACASCCSAAALLNSVLLVPAPKLSSTTFVEAVTTVAPFATEWPDRPPRS